MKLNSAYILVIGLVLTLIIFVSTLVFSMNMMETMRSEILKTSNENNRKTELILTMYESARERVLSLYRMLDTKDAFARDEIFLEFNHNGAEFAQARNELLGMDLSEKEKLMIREQGELAGIVTSQLVDLTAMIQSERLEEARILLNGKLIGVQRKVLEKLERLLAVQNANSDLILKSTDQKFSSNQQLIYRWAFFAFLIGLTISFFVIRGIRKYEETLFNQIEKTNATLSSISDGVITIDDTAVMTYLNSTAISLLGEPEENTRVWDHIRFLGPEYKLAFEEMLRSSDNKDSVLLGQYEISSHGRQRWIDITRSPVFDQRPNLIGIVLVLRDVTEVKDTQLALFKSNETLERRVEERTTDIKETNRKLEQTIHNLKLAQNHMVQTEKMAALGGLVAGISHEVNTPIGTSVTSASSIQENFVRIDSKYREGKLTQEDFISFIDHTRDGLEILNTNLRRASELISSFKKVAVDQTSAEWREINLREYANEIITSLRPRLKSTRVKIECDIDETLTIYTNPGAIYQIFSNLILNSIIHGFSVRGADEEKTGREPTITLNANLYEDNLRLYYMDNGKGMDQETLQKVYDPFFTTRRGQGGSGLGMNIVFNIITSQLKGKVTTDSAPNQGIYVEMILPVINESEVHHVSEHQSSIQ